MSEDEQLALIKFAVEQTLAAERDAPTITVKDSYVREVYQLWKAREATR